MIECRCAEPHARRRIVLTGGPGAGKTAALEMIRQSTCRHVRILPESAGILFGGGFPRGKLLDQRRAAQRAIYHVQCELERTVVADGDVAIVLCDRGTVDGVAYWPGPGDFWAEVGSTAAAELARYDAVIHIRTPASNLGYNRRNPLRIESDAEALAIDERIAAAWAGHPRRYVIEAHEKFLDKAVHVVEALRVELPACCRQHIDLVGHPVAHAS